MFTTPILSITELDTLVHKIQGGSILKNDDLMDLMEFLEPHQSSVVKTAASLVLVDAPITWKQVEQFDIEATVTRNCEDTEAVRMVQLKCAKIELEHLKMTQEIRDSSESSDSSDSEDVEDVTIISTPKIKKAYEYTTTFSSDESEDSEDVTSSDEDTTICWSTVDEFNPPVTSTPLPNVFRTIQDDSEGVKTSKSSEVTPKKVKQAYIFQTTFSSDESEDSEDVTSSDEDTTVCWSPNVFRTTFDDSEDVKTSKSSEVTPKKRKQAYIFQTTFTSSEEEDSEDEVEDFRPIHHSTPIKSKIYQFQTTFDDDL